MTSSSISSAIGKSVVLLGYGNTQLRGQLQDALRNELILTETDSGWEMHVDPEKVFAWCVYDPEEEREEEDADFHRLLDHYKVPRTNEDQDPMQRLVAHLEKTQKGFLK